MLSEGTFPTLIEPPKKTRSLSGFSFLVVREKQSFPEKSIFSIAVDRSSDQKQPLGF